MTAPIVLHMFHFFKLSLYKQCMGSYNSLCFSTLSVIANGNLREDAK